MDPKRRKAAEEAQRKKEQAAAAELANFRASLSWLLADPKGRSFIWGLLKRSNILDREFLEDPYKMYFRDGQQCEGVFIYTEIMITNPDAYAKMWAENAKGD